ncbi:MAG: hypothetical protein J7J67_01590 [Thermoproteales archaeon]|nr:hypothetical protein [Thermoproteales archaeon]
MWRGDKDLEKFDIIEVISRVEGFLVNETALRIGSRKEGEIGGVVDNPVIRDIHDRPYIPGSSIKGVLRSWVEKVARSKGLPVVDPWVKPEGKYMPVEVLFGSQRIGSRLIFYDVTPIIEPKTEVRTGVSIDRVFSTAYPGLLYNIEYVSPGVKWTFRMEAFNIDLIDPPSEGDEKILADLTWSIINALKMGIQIGGRRSVGAGLIKLVEGRIVKLVLENGKLVEKGEKSL